MSFGKYVLVFNVFSSDFAPSRLHSRAAAGPGHGGEVPGDTSGVTYSSLQYMQLHGRCSITL